MEPKTISEPCRHNSKLYTNEEDLNKKSEDTQNRQNQKPNNQLLNSKNTRSSHLSNTVREPDFLRISLLNQENLTFNSRVYQEHIKIYHKFASLYSIVYNYNRHAPELIIYDTKSKSEKIKSIDHRIEDVLWCQNITQLPNGDLICFCYNVPCDFSDSFLIDHNFYMKKLPSNIYVSHTSAIYYNRSFYCFGGVDWPNYNKFSSRFDLDQNRWIHLSPVPENIFDWATVIFNGSILISNSSSNNLWLYSIDIDSFSLILYKLSEWDNDSKKVMVSAEDRLYLIENGFNWCIYESGIWDEFSWKLLTSFRNKPYSSKTLSGIYNKEKESIYILSLKNWEILGTKGECKRAIAKRDYWKFDLNKKMLSEKKRKKCRIF